MQKLMIAYLLYKHSFILYSFSAIENQKSDPEDKNL